MKFTIKQNETDLEMVEFYCKNKIQITYLACIMHIDCLEDLNVSTILNDDLSEYRSLFEFFEEHNELEVELKIIK